MLVVGLLAALVLGALAYLAFRSLRGRGVSFRWHLSFLLAMCVGVAVGVYFGVFFSYFASPSVEVYSFPIPVGIMVLEEIPDGNSQWVDYVTRTPMIVAGCNILVFACLAGFPIWIANTAWRTLKQQGR